MKVLRIINSLKIGGAERLITSTLKYHLQNKIKMDVLVLDNTKSFFFDELIELKIDIFSISNKNIYNPLIIFQLKKYLYEYDIVHVHLFPALYWVAFAKYIFRSKAKLIFTEHSTENRRRRIPFIKYLEQFVYKQYSKIACISQPTRKNLISYLNHQDFNKRTVLIENGIDIDQLWEESKTIDFNLANKFKKRNVILQIAAFRPEKDQKTVINSLNYLPDSFVLILVGDGPLKRDCEAYVQKNNLKSRVIFTGNQKNVGAMIMLADFCVMSSHWEGFGRTAVEAMALGKPVIASNVQGLSDVVEGAGLLFPVGDSRVLANIISELNINKKLYNDISTKCKLRAKNYDIQIMIKKYENIYNEVYYLE